MNTDIFLIDDDKTSNYITSLVLDRHMPESTIICFDNGIKAIDFLHGIAKNNDKLPEYIFLDIDMPMMNAWQFLDDLDRLKVDPGYESKLYLLTMSLFKSDWKKGFAHPRVRGLFAKPLKADDLRKVLE